MGRWTGRTSGQRRVTRRPVSGSLSTGLGLLLPLVMYHGRRSGCSGNGTGLTDAPCNQKNGLDTSSYRAASSPSSSPSSSPRTYRSFGRPEIGRRVGGGGDAVGDAAARDAGGGQAEGARGGEPGAGQARPAQRPAAPARLEVHVQQHEQHHAGHEHQPQEVAARREPGQHRSCEHTHQRCSGQSYSAQPRFPLVINTLHLAGGVVRHFSKSVPSDVASLRPEWASASPRARRFFMQSTVAAQGMKFKN